MRTKICILLPILLLLGCGGRGPQDSMSGFWLGVWSDSINGEQGRFSIQVTPDDNGTIKGEAFNTTINQGALVTGSLSRNNTLELTLAYAQVNVTLRGRIAPDPQGGYSSFAKGYEGDTLISESVIVSIHR